MNRGSLPRTWWTTSAASGFNEAPIHESGKWFWGVRLPESGPLASMRPRFMNRGSYSATLITTPPPPRFNEAPIHESGKFDRRAGFCTSSIWLQ